MVGLTTVTCVRLNTLKPSASTSSLTLSVRLNRRESRASRYQMFGCLKKLRGTNAKRVAPPEPFMPPPGVVLEAKPNEVGVTLPLMFPVTRCPEKAFRIGAIVQPLKIALAAPSANGFGL